MAKTKEALRTDEKSVRIDLIDRPGDYLIRPEEGQEISIPSFVETLLARLKATYSGAQWLGGHTAAELAQLPIGDEDLPTRISAMVSLGEGKVYSVRSTEYPESAPHDLHSRFVIAGRYRAAGERFRFSVSDNPSIIGGMFPWLATLEYRTQDPRGFIRSAVEIVNAIAVQRRLGIYIEA